MLLKFEKKGKTLLVSMVGELDHHSAESVRIKVDNKIEEMGSPNIIFDFSGINFMDSSGIGVVIGRYKKAADYGGKVGIINLKPAVRKVFELGGIFRIIKEYKDFNEAIVNF